MPVFPDEDLAPGAPGAEIDDPYQYEFRSFLFGAKTPYITTKVEGILSMAGSKDHDTDKDYDHGVNPGVLTLGKRIIAFDISISAGGGVDIEQKQAELNKIFQVPRIRYTRVLEPLVYMRPGQVKRQMFVRCTKRDFSSTYKTARGLSIGSVELQAPDPRIFSLDEFVIVKVLNSGATTGTTILTGLGDFADGTLPVIQIDGPATNPTIQNTDDDARTFKLNCVLTAADAVQVDFKNQRIYKRIGIGGAWVEDFSFFANDSRWWAALPGTNNIVCTRQAGNTGAAATYTITYRDVWQ